MEKITETEHTSTVQPILPVSVIVCTRNRPVLVQESIASILDGNCVPAEIVVVDQSTEVHPTLSTFQPTNGCELVYHRDTSVGLSRALNRGIRLARHDILLFADDDIFADKNWLSEMTRALQDGGPNVVVSGQVPPAQESAPNGFVPSTIVDPVPAVYRGRIDTDVLWGNNMGFHRAAVERIGYFDERLGIGGMFLSSNDNDYSYRLLEAGFTILYVPSAVLYHRAWRTNDEFVNLRWRYGVGRGAFYAKHSHLRDRHMLNRMRNDVRIHLGAFVFGLRSNRLKALGDGALGLGILYGALKWRLTQ